MYCLIQYIVLLFFNFNIYFFVIKFEVKYHKIKKTFISYSLHIPWKFNEISSTMHPAFSVLYSPGSFVKKIF